MDVDEQPCPSPYPAASSSSSLLKDISNFKTPQRPSQNPNFHSPCPQFFTASKQTPRPPSSFRRRPSLAPSSSAAARRLKAFELKQSKSARKAQIKKEQSLKSLSKSLTVWLNFLFQNPQSCGCDPSIGGYLGKSVGTASAKGKRDGGPGVSVGVDGRWRSPKRQRDSSWRASESENEENGLDFSNSLFSYLKSSLKDVCSLDDLKERMTVYLSLGSCKEIFTMMTQVAKNIDDGRLTMKTHCPIVTDVGMKEKATRILMCYNPIWLRIGLYIILGGDSLLANGDAYSDQEITFLKMIIERQFFSHSGLAKSYAYNKKVEGLYRPGYYESLGNIILKRILLLVLILDRAKSHSSLPLKYGIDGLDGGSPLLFMVHSGIKSSRQVINDLLSSDIMHGEGNLLAHLVIVGYKVSYQQCPLIEYDFKVTDLFLDLQDGVRLCRAIHLLQHDSSILMKLVVPSDTRKKNTVNCGIALQYLRQANVALHDEDGMMIVGDDVANGDKELILSLLWNMFSQMQLPLLINKTLLVEEICKIREVQDFSHSIGSTPLEILFNWIQAICEHYDFKIKDFSSLVDGKAIWCLLDHYFRKELHCSRSFKDPCETKGEESVVSAIDYSDAVHNFILSQKLTTLLGNFPEVLQISDILEHNGASNDRSVVILLVFLASQLIIKKNMDWLNFHKLFGCNCPSLERKHFDIGHCCAPEVVQNQEVIDGHITEDAVRKFKAIQAWWRDMAEQNYRCVLKPATSSSQCFSTSKHNINIQRDNAAKIIQSHFRGSIERRKFLKMTNAVSFLQTVMRAWLAVRQKLAVNKYCTIKFEEFSRERSKLSETFRRYAMLIVDRHGFVKLKRSVLLIQRAARNWIARKNQGRRIISLNRLNPDLVNAAIVVQKCIRGWTARFRYITRVVPSEKGSLRSQVKSENDVQIKAAVKIQRAWKNFIIWNSLCTQHFAATKIQSHLRCWLLRRWFLIQKRAVTKIQSYLRCLRCYRAFQQYKIATRSAIIIQSYVRGWIEQERTSRHRNLIVVIQRHCRGWMVRRDFLYKRVAAIKIQRAIRCLNYWKAFNRHRHAALDIQRFVRGQMTRNRILGNSSFRAAVPSHCIFHTSVGCFWSFELKIVLFSVLRLQRWWKGVLLLRLKTKSAVIIQAHIRGWIIKRKAARERHCIVVIQSYWKGYLARKESREQLYDLRLRVEKSAANVDDGMRIINRLLVALSELLSMKSVSGILHICATLDMATAHSQKCCEELVAAGAISTLLKLIGSVSRSIPDQEVLKHALSTLRNLVRYPHLVQVLIDSRGSVETILWELLRNKEEGYFIASELLQKICSEQRGAESVRNSPALLKRLHSMVEELARKANFEKRNARGLVARETNTERRLREAVELLKLTLNG